MTTEVQQVLAAAEARVAELAEALRLYSTECPPGTYSDNWYRPHGGAWQSEVDMDGGKKADKALAAPDLTRALAIRQAQERLIELARMMKRAPGCPDVCGCLRCMIRRTVADIDALRDARGEG